MGGNFNYVQKCFELFPRLTREMFGQEYYMTEIEKMLSHVKEEDCLERNDIIKIVEAREWDFKKFWPDLANALSIDKPIRGIFKLDWEGRRKTIFTLYKNFFHIELVSVILRFIDPQNYAIISPPVEKFFSLQPKEDHVEYYANYLTLLKKTSKRFLVPTRLADIDMALWSLFFLTKNWGEEEFRKKWTESESSTIQLILYCYKNDRFFKKIRLSEALKQAYQDIEENGYEPNRVFLADCLDSEQIDPALAMITISFSFENFLWNLIEETGQADVFRQLRSREKWIKKLEQDKIIESSSIFQRCLELRDRSVHPWLEKLSHVEREEFIANLEKLMLMKKVNRL